MAVLIIFTMALSLTACGSANSNEASSRQTSEAQDTLAHSEVIVAYFSTTGITVIPFCTSGGSGIGRSGPNMEALAGNGTWLQGKRFSGNVPEADLKSWIDGLK